MANLIQVDWSEQLNKTFNKLPLLYDSERLSYVPLSLDNYEILLEMFENDDNEFIYQEYRFKDKLKEYAKHILEYGRNSTKYGAFDWLIKLKSTEFFIGVINLYDLSLGTFNDQDRKCTIGIHIVENFRNKYYASEAVNNLTSFCFNELDKIRILAYTNLLNEAAKNLFVKSRFIDNTKDYYYNDKYLFFEKWNTNL